MEKDHPAVEIQMSGNFVSALDSGNNKNFRDRLFHAPGKELNIDQEKNDKGKKNSDCHHKDSSE
jgi:hypothetical protein